MSRKFDFWTLVMIGTWGILLLLLFIPVGSVLLSSFFDTSGNATIENYLRFFAEPRFQRAFINTLVVGFGGLAGCGRLTQVCQSRLYLRKARLQIRRGAFQFRSYLVRLDAQFRELQVIDRRLLQTLADVDQSLARRLQPLRHLLVD